MTDKRSRLRTAAVVGIVATGSLIGLAAAASADVPAAGMDCGSGQIGDSATAADGGALRCLADDQGKLHWLPDTHSVATIADLQSAGYSVTVERTGDRPLPDCTVVEVHNAMTTTSLNSGGTSPGGPGSTGSEHLTTIVVTKSIDVTLNCNPH